MVVVDHHLDLDHEMVVAVGGREMG